jgi:hypothetical protein
VDQTEFYRRFCEALDATRSFAVHLVPQELPNAVRCDFQSGMLAILPDGRVKFVGGRLIEPARLLGVDRANAARYLWVNDGRIPPWVNLSPNSRDDDFLYVSVRFNHELLTRNHGDLPRDLNHDESHDIRPFRIRGRDPAQGLLPRREQRNQVPK